MKEYDAGSDESILENAHLIREAISTILSNFNSLEMFLLKAAKSKVHNLLYSEEIGNIALLLGIPKLHAIVYQVICEYYIESTTIAYHHPDKGIIFFRGFNTPCLKILQKLFIMLNTSEGHKVLTLAGYTGYICVFHSRPSILSVEYSLINPEISLAQAIFRYFKYKRTPGQLLRKTLEEGEKELGNPLKSRKSYDLDSTSYDRPKLVHRMRNTTASIPFNFNLMDSPLLLGGVEGGVGGGSSNVNVLRIHHNIVTKYGLSPCVQTYGDSRSMRTLEDSYKLVNYIKRDNYESISSKFGNFYIYCKLNRGEITFH